MFIALNDLLPWLLAYGYLVIFPLSVVEGPIITILSGFLLSQGYFNMLLVYLLIVFGDLVGDTLYYALGKWGLTHFTDKWGKYIGITRDRIMGLEKHFESHAGKTLMLGKLAHGIGGAALVAAGVVHVPYKKFLWFNLIGTLPKTLVLLLIGYYVGQTYAKINRYLDYTAWITLVLAALTIIIYLAMRKGAQKISDKEAV